MIYGENTATLSFEKGLFLTDTGDALGDGFVTELINMEVDVTGHLKDRGDFYPCIFNATSADIGMPIDQAGPDTGRPPDYLNAQTVKLFRFYPPSVNQTTPVLVLCRNTNPTNQKVWSTASGKGAFNEGMEQSLDVATRRILDLTSYRDRYYACNQAKTEIYQVSNFNTASFSPPNLVTTLLFTVSGVTKLFTFGDRIFALAGNKLYFTDLATVGGYPEVWSTTNVIEMPSSRGGGPLVTAVPVNNRVYLFTEAGVYVLYASGDPTSWSLQYISDQIRVAGEAGVCLTQNSIICCDRSAIYAFSDSGATRIDYPIADVFNTYNSSAIFPFENGFILVVTNFLANGGLWIPNRNKTYFYNGNSWSELQLTPTVEHFEDVLVTVVGATSPVFTHNSKDKARSALAYIYTDTGTSSNFLGMSHYDPSTSNRNKTLSVTTVWYTKPISTLKRWIHGFVDVYSKLVGFNYEAVVDGANFVGSTFIQPTPLNDDRNAYVRVSTPQFNRRVAFKITATVPTTGGGGWSPDTVPNPIFKLKSIQLLGNDQERSHPDGTS